jgi:hypothetical protein
MGVGATVAWAGWVADVDVTVAARTTGALTATARAAAAPAANRTHTPTAAGVVLTIMMGIMIMGTLTMRRSIQLKVAPTRSF